MTNPLYWITALIAALAMSAAFNITGKSRAATIARFVLTTIVLTAAYFAGKTFGMCA